MGLCLGPSKSTYTPPKSEIPWQIRRFVHRTETVAAPNFQWRLARVSGEAQLKKLVGLSVLSIRLAQITAFLSRRP